MSSNSEDYYGIRSDRILLISLEPRSLIEIFLHKQIGRTTESFLKALFFKWENHDSSSEKQKKKNSTIFTNDHIKVFAQFSNARERVTLSAKRHFLFGTWLYGCSPVSYERPAMPTHPTWSQDSKLTPDLWAET